MTLFIGSLLGSVLFTSCAVNFVLSLILCEYLVLSNGYPFLYNERKGLDDSVIKSYIHITKILPFRLAQVPDQM